MDLLINNLSFGANSNKFDESIYHVRWMFWPYNSEDTPKYTSVHLNTQKIQCTMFMKAMIKSMQCKSWVY